MNGTSAQWYLAITNPRCERRAQFDLEANGYRTFMPTSKNLVRHARMIKPVTRPILSRYLFVEVDYPEQSFGAVRLCNGVESLLTTDGRPAPVHRSFVEDLMLRQLRGEWDFVTQDHVRFVDAQNVIQVRENVPLPVGTRIKIMEGQFADMLATITKVKGKKLAVRIIEGGKSTHELVWNVRAA